MKNKCYINKFKTRSLSNIISFVLTKFSFFQVVKHNVEPNSVIKGPVLQVYISKVKLETRKRAMV